MCKHVFLRREKDLLKGHAVGLFFLPLAILCMISIVSIVFYVCFYAFKYRVREYKDKQFEELAKTETISTKILKQFLRQKLEGFYKAQNIRQRSILNDQFCSLHEEETKQSTDLLAIEKMLFYHYVIHFTKSMQCVAIIS